MDKAGFLAQLRRERARWEEIIDEVGPARLSQPGAAGDWSVKDIVAHVAWGEREMVGVLEQRALVGSDLWQVGQEQRNAAVYEQNRNRDAGDVLTEEQAVYRRLLDLLEELPEEHLGNPARFDQMPAHWAPWQVLAQNTYEHYRDHVRDIRTWLDGQVTV